MPNGKRTSEDVFKVGWGEVEGSAGGWWETIISA